MKAFAFGILSLIAGVTAAQSVQAFSQDDKSLNDSHGEARFSDPDEQVPGGALKVQGAQDKGSVDPSSIRYDYDPASGGYIPHRR